MTKAVQIKNIQKRLPDDIRIQDETGLKLSDDEYVSILSWIKLFIIHYKSFGKSQPMPISSAIVSKRVHIDFGLYMVPCELEHNKGEYIIYLCSNDYEDSELTLSKFINNWSL